MLLKGPTTASYSSEDQSERLTPTLCVYVQVEMGPFKHTVDDGLDLRKAAFECMYTLLDSCLDRIDIFTFLNHVEDGLKDHYDIKVRTPPSLGLLSVSVSVSGYLLSLGLCLSLSLSLWFFTVSL